MTSYSLQFHEGGTVRSTCRRYVSCILRRWSQVCEEDFSSMPFAYALMPSENKEVCEFDITSLDMLCHKVFKMWHHMHVISQIIECYITSLSRDVTNLQAVHVFIHAIKVTAKKVIPWHHIVNRVTSRTIMLWYTNIIIIFICYLTNNIRHIRRSADVSMWYHSMLVVELRRMSTTIRTWCWILLHAKMIPWHVIAKSFGGGREMFSHLFCDAFEGWNRLERVNAKDPCP